MKELIKVSFDNCERPTVLGRDLHEFLEIDTQYDKWIKRKIKQYSFIENIDYIELSHERISSEGNREVKRTIINHQLTLDMAKQLSMLAEGNKGIEARKYFIKCEEIAKQKNNPSLKVYSLRESLEMNIQLLNENEILVNELEIVKDKRDRLANAKGGIIANRNYWKRKHWNR